MSGDLEDFLRRAAQRRQAKAAQQRPAPQRQRPEYSNRRTERQIRAADSDEALTAEVVDQDSNSISARMKRVEEAKKAAAEARAEAAKKSKKAKAGAKRSAAVALSGDPTQSLINMLRQPGGIQQAILLREILDRPEHRW